MTRQMKPFRALLKPSTVFQWTDELDRLFHETKEIIIKKMKEGVRGVRLFDPTRITCLATDLSVDGIGFFLMQKYCQCLKKLLPAVKMVESYVELEAGSLIQLKAGMLPLKVRP